MGKGIGRLIQVGIAKETSRGTAIAQPTFMIAFADLAVDDKNERALDEQALGVIEGSAGESIVREWSEAEITAPIGVEHFPLVLLATLGSLSTSIGTATGTPCTHTITVQEGAQHQSLTLHVDDPVGGQDYKHALAVPGSLELAFERDNFLNYSVNFMAKQGAAASVTPVAVTEKRFLPQHLTFRVATTQAGLGSGTAIALKSAMLTINQNAEGDYVLGSTAPVDFLNKQFEIEGEVEALWQSETDFKTNSLTGTARALRFDIINTGEVIGGGSTNPSLRIDLHKVIFEPITRAIKLNDMVSQKLSFKAHYSVTDSKMVTITAVNATQSY